MSNAGIHHEIFLPDLYLQTVCWALHHVGSFQKYSFTCLCISTMS